jgi:hypothetical protein
MTVPVIACRSCVHLLEERKCKAFTSGIPEDILIGKNNHKKPFKGDNGIRFEPIKDLTNSRSLSRLANKERNSV